MYAAPALDTPAEPATAGLVRRTCRIPGDFLNDGIYRIRLIAGIEKRRSVLDYANALRLEVFDGDRHGAWLGRVRGIVRPKLDWSAPETIDPAAGRVEIAQQP